MSCTLEPWILRADFFGVKKSTDGPESSLESSPDKILEIVLLNLRSGLQFWEQKQMSYFVKKWYCKEACFEKREFDNGRSR